LGKKELVIEHYGRYVDDFILIHENKVYLQSVIPTLSDFLLSTLHLSLHPDKICLQRYFTQRKKFSEKSEYEAAR